MKNVDLSDALKMWGNISEKYKEPYGKRLSVKIDGSVSAYS